MTPASPELIIGLPGEVVGYPPSIKLTGGPPDRMPVVGETVVFTFSGGKGSEYSTITDSNGRATLANLQVDKTPGEYEITASVKGAGSLTFAVRSLSGRVISTYDLVSLDGFYLPVGSVIGGHYELLDNGTFRRGIQQQGKFGLYDRTGEKEWLQSGVFITRPSGQIEFYVDAPPASNGGPTNSLSLLSVGTFSAGRMIMAYRDVTQFFDEEYVLGN